MRLVTTVLTGSVACLSADKIAAVPVNKVLNIHIIQGLQSENEWNLKSCIHGCLMSMTPMPMISNPRLYSPAQPGPEVTHPSRSFLPDLGI